MAVHLVMRITFLLLLTYELAEAAPPPIAKPNCPSRCGNVTEIPYPFGIGPGCYMNRTFEIVCNGTGSSAKAFLPSIDMEVLQINMSFRNYGFAYYPDDYYVYSSEPGLVRVNMPIISSSNCNGSRSGGGVNMTGSPFYFSYYWNSFIAVGCDNMAIMTGIDPVVTGCKSDCNDKSMRTNDGDQKCSGFKCCQTAVPRGIQVLHVDFNSTECKHACIAESNWLDSNKTDPSDYVQYLEYVPVMLVWTATNEARSPNSYAEATIYGGVYYHCDNGYQGNPYLPTGCEGKLQIQTALILV